MEICFKDKCTGCGVCSLKCPQKCITMKEDKEGFVYPEIDKNLCIGCKNCQRICPNNVEIKKGNSKFYMAINKNKDVLKKSSSGGAFSAIANWIFDKDGVVVGAYNDVEKKEVRHVVVESIKDLDKIRTSKYYQSDIRESLILVADYLKNDRYVLFSGTACQIAALYAFLPKEHLDRLYTVDVLCHGVSNKKIVNQYLTSQENRFRKKIKDYKFRIKDDKIGWHSGGGTKMYLVFEDGEIFIERNRIDTFFMAFNKNVILRESCYNCKYCGTKRISDFTLADFWGATKKRVSNEMQKNGVSVLTFNSEKSLSIFKDLKHNLDITKIDEEEVVPFNMAFEKPNSRPIERENFFDKLDKINDFEKTVKSVYRKSYIKNRIKALLGEKITLKIKKIKESVKNEKK